jgi:hypothetical protein
MYGMVNKAVVDMVQAHFGEVTWQAIRAHAGIDEDVFLSMSQYPDDLTYRMVAAASSVLRLSPEQVLQAFGQYWVTYTAAQGYGELLKLQGRTIWEFLANLDNMHARVGLSFRNLRPPSFQCTDQTATSVHLHYLSHRRGLSHLVIGLLKGLGEMLKTPVDVQLLSHAEDAAGCHDVFLIQQVNKT